MEKDLNFITIKDFSLLTGWSIRTCQNVFNLPDFPSSDYGKEKIAEVEAVRKFFEQPRRRN